MQLCTCSLNAVVHSMQFQVTEIEARSTITVWLVVMQYLTLGETLHRSAQTYTQFVSSLHKNCKPELGCEPSQEAALQLHRQA